jgi:23S rRNA pseudouridine1911/1915/1917 synthase
MHSSPLKGRSGETLAGWTAKLFPELRSLQGRGEGEGGLIHRLDYDTQGLVLFGRTQGGMDSLLAQQDRGNISKEYSALVSKPETILPGFPPLPLALQAFMGGPFPVLVESPFRAWGPGRKAVRPALSGTAGGRKRAFDRGSPYSTRILEWREEAAPFSGAERLRLCRAGILRGFRHQIRCHLAWLGFPILNDSLYGGAGESLLALRACSLSFDDPLDGYRRVFEIPAFQYGQNTGVNDRFRPADIEGAVQNV